MRSPSSIAETPSAEEPLQALVSEELQKLPPGVHVDLGPSLPAFYEVNRLVLMVQDPFHIFAYWEITDSLKSQVLSRFPEEDRVAFQLVLDWFQLEGGQRTTFDLGTMTYWWLKANPGFHYQARLCFYSESYGTAVLQESNIVESPKYSIELSDSQAAKDQEATVWLTDLLEMTSVAKIKPVTDSAITEAGLPFSEPVLSKDLADRRTSDERNRGSSPENSDRRTDSLPSIWPTSW